MVETQPSSIEVNLDYQDPSAGCHDQGTHVKMIANEEGYPLALAEKDDDPESCKYCCICHIICLMHIKHLL